MQSDLPSFFIGQQPPEKKKIRKSDTEPLPPPSTKETAKDDDDDDNTHSKGYEEKEEEEEEEEGKDISSEKKGTRLVIDRMVLENFKSYAGVQEIGPFDRCFTAVVGPNGSGKSNVLDGLLFVFGKRAKQIRQKRLGELVHESARYPNLTQASVTVYFYDVAADTDERVPGSELVLRRTVNKKSESVYYLNGRVKRFAEIAAVLREKGIDLEHNRFLILQGEVEQIAMMPPKAPVNAAAVAAAAAAAAAQQQQPQSQQPPPQSSSSDEGMLDYLEDVIGTTHFIGEIQRATIGLDQANEECAQRERRLALVQDELDALKGPKEDAEEFLNTETLIFEKKGAVAHMRRAAASEAAETLEGEHATLAAENTEAQAALENARGALGAAESAANEAGAALQAAKDQFDKVSGDYNACNNRSVELGEREKHLRGKEKKLKKEIGKDEAKAAAKAKELEQIKTALTGQQKALEELREKTQEEDAKYERMIPELQKVTGELKRQVETREAELVPHKTRAQELHTQISVHKSEIELINKALEEKIAQHRQLVASIDDIAKDELRIKDEMAKNARALEDRTRSLEKLRSSLAEQQKKEQECDAALRAIAARLREAKDFKESLKSRGKVYGFINGLKKSVSGIYVI